MKIIFANKDNKQKGVLVVPIFEEFQILNIAPFFSAELADFLKKRHEAGEFKAKEKEILETYWPEKDFARRVIFFGLGKKDTLNDNLARILGANWGKIIKKSNSRQVNLIFPPEMKDYAQTFFEGFLLAQYEYSFYKKRNEEEKKVAALEIWTDKEMLPELKKALIEAGKIVEAVDYVKDLVNMPSNVVDMDYLMNEAKKVAKVCGAKVKIFRDKDLEKMNWGGLLSVNRGSGNEAGCAVLEYRAAKNPKEKPIVLVGKGIVFDSGGYNLKPTKAIETMHQDMAGAGVVLGVFKALNSLRVKKNVVGIIPSAENLINENAYRPSDIITMASGLTVEITNTDAEGRLILADALHYATKLEPEALISIATLTGAVGVALGDRYAGLMSNDSHLCCALKKAGEEVDDLAWELPIHPDFKKRMESEIADLKNCDIVTGKAGSQTGAAFLENFVGKNRWCHIDIGGTAFTTAPRDFEQIGATAHGLRMILRYLQYS